MLGCGSDRILSDTVCTLDKGNIRDMSEKIIQISNVSFQYENSEKGALHDVSLTVEPGECILLCGESGCGKQRSRAF